MVDPITASVAKFLVLNATKGLFAIQKINELLEKAENLLDSNLIEDGTELVMALSVDRGMLIPLPSTGLLKKTMANVSTLTDKYKETRELKQRFLKHVFLAEDFSDRYILWDDGMDFLKTLDNKYHSEFKEYLLLRIVNEQGYFGIDDSVLEGVGDEKFRKGIKKIIKQMKENKKKALAEAESRYNTAYEDNWADTYHPGLSG